MKIKGSIGDLSNCKRTCRLPQGVTEEWSL